MQTVAKFFDELSTKELYEILKARAEVFVVEQKCTYQDLDDVDYDSLHVFFEEDGVVRAYLRAFVVEEGIVKVGRVLTIEHGRGLGGKLLKEGLAQIRKIFAPRQIVVDAQTYVVGFYEREGFRVVSDEFLEVDIPHVTMILEG